MTTIDPNADVKHPKLAQGNGAHVIVANDWIFYSEDGGAVAASPLCPDDG